MREVGRGWIKRDLRSERRVRLCARPANLDPLAGYFDGFPTLRWPVGIAAAEGALAKHGDVIGGRGATRMALVRLSLAVVYGALARHGRHMILAPFFVGEMGPIRVVR